MIEKYTEIGDGDVNEITFEGISGKMMNANNYFLDCLSNKELVFKFDAEITYTGDVYNSSSKTESTKTYEKK